MKTFKISMANRMQKQSIGSALNFDYFGFPPVWWMQCRYNNDRAMKVEIENIYP
jgi:hypothetical protein